MESIFLRGFRCVLGEEFDQRAVPRSVTHRRKLPDSRDPSGKLDPEGKVAIRIGTVNRDSGNGPRLRVRGAVFPHTEGVTFRVGEDNPAHIVLADIVARRSPS